MDCVAVLLDSDSAADKGTGETPRLVSAGEVDPDENGSICESNTTWKRGKTGRPAFGTEADISILHNIYASS